jgi:hypothetical protein
MGRRRLRPIPGESAAGSAGGMVGEARGLTLGRFVPGVGAERSADGWHVSARRRPPREFRLRREGRTTTARCNAGRSKEDGETPRGFARHWRMESLAATAMVARRGGQERRWSWRTREGGRNRLNWRPRELVT